VNPELLHPARQIVQVMQRIYAHGMTTTTGGNLSIREEGGDVWITPRGLDKGSLTPQDVVQVKPDGRVVGRHAPSVELPCHQMIYAARPDLRAVVHAHPPALVAFSLVRKSPDTTLLPMARLACGEVGMAEYGLPGSTDLGEKIARAFAAGSSTVILENHGTMVGAEDLSRAFMAFETLDFCARLEIDARRIGTPTGLDPARISLWDREQLQELEEFRPRRYSSHERESRREMCELLRRACDQRLFTSAHGSLSHRLDPRSFVITPEGIDRRTTGPGDIARIEDGCREAGKSPSRSVRLHQRIYDAHPQVGSIIVAHPPALMAFAVTGEQFDTRTIPESYIVLRDVVRLPFGCGLLGPEGTGVAFSRDAPVALADHDCAIVTAGSLIDCFDRLEVADYSARALIACRSLGALVRIDEQQAAAIDQAFPPRWT
jgi:L-fuculose-phosphate aldolase